MDLGVAIVALDLRIMDLTVALDANQPDLALGQEKTVRRSMGNVASTASLVLRGPVLKDKGASLFGMAFETRVFFRELVDLPQVCVRPRPVGGMTVGAGHPSARGEEDRMTVREIKLRLHIGVAGETKIGFFLLEKILRNLRTVRLMAIIACNRTQFVNTSQVLKKGFVFLMAAQAGLGPNLSVGGFEREAKRLLALRIGMLFARTVAGLAPLLLVEDDLRVRVPFCEAVVEIFVAPLAGLRAHVSRLLLAKGREANEGYRSYEGDDEDRQVFASIHDCLLH